MSTSQSQQVQGRLSYGISTDHEAVEFLHSLKLPYGLKSSFFTNVIELLRSELRRLQEDERRSEEEARSILISKMRTFQIKIL